METFTLFIVTILVSFCVYYLLKPKKRPDKFPPGPAGIPLFGNALQSGADTHRYGVLLEPVYGPIIGMKFGAYLFVILNNADDIREAYNRAEFQGRFGYNPFLEEITSFQTKGVVMSQGQHWQDMRRFSLKTLREFGFGKRSIESSIQEEVRELIEVKFRPNLGKPIVNHELFNASVLNVIWALVAGERYKLGDERLTELIRIVSIIFKSAFDGAKIFNFMFPSVVKFRKMLPFNLPDSSIHGQKKLLDFLMKTIQEHRVTFQSGNPRDFIDVYLEERMQGKDNSSRSTAEEDTLLAYTLFDLFGAGSDTTSTTLSWALFLLASHPDVQEKLFQEIQALAGNRAVSLDDRVKMPYTEAVMLEVHRMASLAPVGVPHSTTEDVEFKGYRIPKNTMIFANFFACHFSEPNWGDPFNFRPERFISSVDGTTTFTKNPNVLAFSVGKRQCLGETTAKDEFFIFLTNIVQQLKIVFPKDEPKHTLEGQRGLVLTPITHRIIFLDRNNS